jgi:long-chain acyl-CoA synthetase
MFRRKLLTKPEANPESLPIGLGQSFEEVARRFKRRQANLVAGGLESLGISAGDRAAIMLPNMPEFYFSFFGIHKLGAIAVPFNTMYRGREITHILQASGAKAIICLSNFAGLIQEIQRDCSDLDYIVVTGQRTFVYTDPEATVNVQMVFEKNQALAVRV